MKSKISHNNTICNNVVVDNYSSPFQGDRKKEAEENGNYSSVNINMVNNITNNYHIEIKNYQDDNKEKNGLGIIKTIIKLASYLFNLL